MSQRHKRESSLTVVSGTGLLPVKSEALAADSTGELVTAPPPEAVAPARPEPRKDFGEGSRSLRSDALSDWHKAHFLGLITEGLSLPHAALAVGRSVRTIYRWMAEDAYFKRSFHENRSRAASHPLELIRRHADHNLQAAIYLHKQVLRGERRRRQERSEPHADLVGQLDLAIRQLFDGLAEKFSRIPDIQVRRELMQKLREYADNVDDVMTELWAPTEMQLRHD